MRACVCVAAEYRPPSTQQLTGSKEVEVGVSAQHPEAVVVTAEGLHAGPLGHVPHPDALVLRVGQNELLAGMEDGARYVVIVPPAGVQLPRLGLCRERGTRHVSHYRSIQAGGTESPVAKRVSHHSSSIF